jgi:hypothetical protein
MIILFSTLIWEGQRFLPALKGWVSALSMTDEEKILSDM